MYKYLVILHNNKVIIRKVKFPREAKVRKQMIEGILSHLGVKESDDGEATYFFKSKLDINIDI